MKYSYCSGQSAIVNQNDLAIPEAYRIQYSYITPCAYFTSNWCILSYSVMKKIQIDLRGTIFVSRSLALQNTLERLTSKNLAEVISDGNYYLDRNPLIFHHILDFYSEGRFHLPRNICPIQARREVEFWGIPLTEVPPCCYETLYGDNESELKAISALEEEINEVEEKYNQMKRQHDTSGSFSWIAIRYKLVHALNFPMQTLLGRVSLHVT